ncbi:MAG: hypothetical protein E3J43_02625 [Candidatus Heimdallarchaeota archaeon]|nr:MAG: hypothetical protein E3J43_02625 [Candidatus Heimdallarchaeota archaeon]
MFTEEFVIEEELLLEEDEIEDIYQYHGAEYDELPFIEFKDYEEENHSDFRLTLFFVLLLAMVGAVVLGFLTPRTYGETLNDIYWWTPLIGGLIGAFLGGFIGLVIDSLIYARSKGNQQAS